VSKSTWESLKLNTPLKKPDICLYGPDRSQLKVLGMLPVSLYYNNHTSMQAVYVIDKLTNNLLGLPAIKGLKLLLNVCSIQTSIMSQYPYLFSGLGTFTQEYTIKLDTKAKPFALSTPRNIPLPLRAKVQTELKHL